MFDIFPLKGGLDNVDGFFSDGLNSGIKTSSIGEKIDGDLAFIRSDCLCEVEALFTSNHFQAAPIKHFKSYGKDFKTDFLLINSKNANALTGEKGIEDIKEILSHIKNVNNPIMSSTGVIGYPLDKEKIINTIKKFDFSTKNSDNAARAILTTDRFKKEICLRVEPKGQKPFHVAAICKGAGMIEPSMATMLCFIITDTKIPKEDMKKLLLRANEKSFNAISVDGDTSTNDTLMLLANGKSQSYDKKAFKAALDQITLHLALEIVKDGEGSSKIVSFCVKGAKSKSEAQRAAKALSNSLLVKTAIFGEDPNWGRIASTIGSSNIKCDEKSLKIHYDDVLVYEYEHSILAPQKEELAHKVMKKPSYKITCDLGIGDGEFTAYGCDLGYGYVKLNAHYRT
ncbi:MAG: bifunctional ornithine acetyltransferase/N-acetylglutamate synthase [Proteobacteria bacterium]|nr:MAG: bifunctional ornithine acetyltransferase/N-acetylglutamate synthase [Pseudomonadota bacterium]